MCAVCFAAGSICIVTFVSLSFCFDTGAKNCYKLGNFPFHERSYPPPLRLNCQHLFIRGHGSINAVKSSSRYCSARKELSSIRILCLLIFCRLQTFTAQLRRCNHYVCQFFLQSVTPICTHILQKNWIESECISTVRTFPQTLDPTFIVNL